eukprot:TRINITY_DN184613_c0_g1_i1.p1 TRINITY_DN184613_c0_g1~~TRINITY_DN184613_c0_g1_i1.p1  ORF type:complete len:207 (-),score=-6.50 TRINITY_DN184613_c0_g1_i1:30-650(-)
MGDLLGFPHDPQEARDQTQAQRKSLRTLRPRGPTREGGTPSFFRKASGSWSQSQLCGCRYLFMYLSITQRRLLLCCVSAARRVTLVVQHFKLREINQFINYLMSFLQQLQTCCDRGKSPDPEAERANPRGWDPELFSEGVGQLVIVTVMWLSIFIYVFIDNSTEITLVLCECSTKGHIGCSTLQTKGNQLVYQLFNELPTIIVNVL